MSRKDATNKKSFWKSRLGFVIATLLVIGASISIRFFLGAEPAHAQEQRRRSRATTRQTAKSGARTAKTTATRPAKPVNPIAAVVNGQKITRDQLASQCVRRFGEEVLESLVNKHLILQECQRQAIKITRQDIDNEINDIAKKFNISAELWLGMLQQEKQIAPEQYKLDVIWPTLALRRLAADKLTVSKAELAKEFDAEYGPKVQVRMISVTSKQKADQLLAKVKAAPKSFGNIAKDHSEDPNSAAARGLIPPIRKHLGYPEVENVAFGMQPGDISPVIHVANQYLILKCEKHLEPAVISAQFRHDVEVRLTDRIRDRKLRTASAELFTGLQKSAKVVNVLNDKTMQQQMPGVAAMINGRKITMKKLGQECLIRHGVNVLDSEINYRLLKQELTRLSMQVSDDDLDEEIARAAEAFGFLKKNGSPDVEKWLKDVTEKEGVAMDVYIRDAVWPTAALKKIVGNSVKISAEDLEKGFDANYGERVKVLAIVLANQRTAQEVWELARKDPSKENFGKLAEQYSIEPVSRADFGEVPPIHKHGGQPLVEQEAFSLKQDELSGIIAVGDKFIILKCLGRTERVVQRIDDVKAELVAHIREQKMRVAMSDRFEKIKASAKVDNYFALTAQTASPSIRKTTQPETAKHRRVVPASSRTSARTKTKRPAKATRR